jgi:hypothetical protein
MSSSHIRGRGALLVALVVLVAAPSAQAQTEGEGTGWEAFTQAYPTNLHPGGTGTIQIDVMNVGARRSSGAITVTDTLPQGVSATAAGGMFQEGEELSGTRVASVKHEEEVFGGVRWDCAGIGTRVVTCTSDPAYLKPIPNANGPVERIAVEVSVEAGAPQGTPENVVSITGGGATHSTVASDPVTLSFSEPAYGFSNWDEWSSNAAGELDTQAGSHPYETTFALGYNELASPMAETAGGEFRNLEAELPPGFSGEPNSAPRCTRPQLDANECPPDTQIGVNLAMHADEAPGGGGSVGSYDSAVYNMVAPPGVVDQFAVDILGHDVFFDTAPRGGGGYNLVTRIDDIPQGVDLDGNILTLWGVASEASHTPERCTSANGGYECGLPSSAPPRPFLTLPTSCEGPQAFTIRGLGTWTEAGARAQDSVASHNALDTETGYTGCAALSFDPSLSAVPDTSEADTPAGLAVNVTFPQEALRVPGGLVESTTENTTVTLPEGLVINPGQAAGLAACSEAQAKLEQEGAPECPLASKVGTAKVQTPLLEGLFESELTGDVYVFEQSKGGPGEPLNLESDPPTLQLLIALSGDGINLKLVANVQLDKQTGRVTTTLTKTPSIPFTSFELALSGGAQAALATPAGCGSYAITSDFTPWASPFIEDASPTSVFQIASGPGGGPCPSGALPFGPTLIAGSTTDQAGGFTGFTMLLQRGDGQQRIERLQFKAPPGLSGVISNVPPCTNAQAEADACPEASKIGHTVVTSGPGPFPLIVPEPGRPAAPIYLTEGYGGAPFGLAIVVPLQVGPFTLETQKVRAKIEIDPATAQIVVTTNPLPQVVDGVPTDLRSIDAVIDREDFMINPTNCKEAGFTGTAWGTPPPGQPSTGTSAPLSSRFQVGSCRSLAFTPKFTVSTLGAGSKADGASLSVKMVYPKAAQGFEADISSVKVDLPVQLPSRLSTLQQACTAHQFKANPAGCPAASVVGHAVVHTPVLPMALEGPAYFVSNGSEEFPNLILVLQGDGVTIELVGETFISKSSITSSTFKAVPDQPFSSFELTLPEGPDSALGPNVPIKDRYSFCGQKMVMPTSIVGQNGAEIKQQTPITVTGCKTTMSNAQRLAAALKACHKDKGNARRTACDARAHKKYATPKPKKKKKQ